MPNEVVEHKNADNPFATAQVATRPANAIATSDQQRAIAEVQAAMMIARMNPRDPKAAMDRILQACTRPTLAEQALYTYNRGGSDVTGPSIRLAEAIAQSWGNFQFGIRELEQRNGESTVEAFAWDVETNTRQVKVFQVPHIRYTRRGTTKLEDPRDIYEMVANQGARRLRACILGVIPGDVIESAVKQAEITMKTKAEVTPERIKNLLEKFGEFGVTKEMLEKRIQRHIESMTPALLVQLGKIYNSLKDGMSSIGDWFDQPEQAAPTGTPSATSALKDKLRGGAKKSDGSVDQETGEIKDVKQPQPEAAAAQADGPSFEDAIRYVQAGDDDMARDIASSLGDEALAKINQMIAHRSAEKADGKRSK